MEPVRRKFFRIRVDVELVEATQYTEEGDEELKMRAGESFIFTTPDTNPLSVDEVFAREITLLSSKEIFNETPHLPRPRDE